MLSVLIFGEGGGMGASVPWTLVGEDSKWAVPSSAFLLLILGVTVAKEEEEKLGGLGTGGGAGPR